MTKSKIILVSIICVIVGAIGASIYFTFRSKDDKDGGDKTETKPKGTTCSHGCQGHSHNKETPCSSNANDKNEGHKHECTDGPCKHETKEQGSTGEGQGHKHEECTDGSCEHKADNISSNASTDKENKNSHSENGHEHIHGPACNCKNKNNLKDSPKH